MGIFQALIDQGKQSALEAYAQQNYADNPKLLGLAKVAPEVFLKKIGEDLDTGNSQAAAKERAGIFADQPKPLAQLPQGELASQYLLGDARTNAGAIGQIESNKNYNEVGPMTKHGRALGKYQVMEENVPSWTKEALGQELTPEQFLSSKQAQDQVFAHHFGKSVEKFGNPQDAASIWFTGRPQAQGANASDLNGVTGSQYVNRFNSALGQLPQQASQPQQSALASYNQVASAQPQAMTDAPSDTAATPPAQLAPPQQPIQQVAQAAPQNVTNKMQGYIDRLSQSKLKENRELGKKLELETLQKQLKDPEIKEFEDPSTGVKVPYTLDRNTGQWNKVKLPGGEDNAASNVDEISAARDAGVPREELIKQIPPVLKDYTAALLEGRSIPANLARNSSLRAQAILYAHALDSNFDETIIPQRQAVAKSMGSFTPTSFGGQTAAAEKILNHAGKYFDLIPSLGNADLGGSYTNVPLQSLKANNPLSQEDRNKYQEIRSNASQLAEGVAGETSKLMTGGIGSEATRNEYRGKIASTLNPNDIRGGLKGISNLMEGQVQANIDQYNRAFGTNKTLRDFLTPKAQEIYDKINLGEQPAENSPDNEGWKHAGVVNGQPVKIRLKK